MDLLRVKMDEEWEGVENDTSNCTGFYTSHQKKVIFISVGSTGLVSVSLCVVAIALLLWFKLHKKFAYRLASYQVITSMLISCTVVMATVPIIGKRYFVFCQIIGFFLEYFLWTKLLFVLCLIYHIFCLAVFSKNFKHLEPCYILVSFCVPLLFTWIPFVHRSYGLTESWCWIRDTECNGDRYMIGFIEQYVLWFGPLAVCIIASFIAIIVILVAIKKRYNQVIETEVSENNPLIENPVKTYMLRVYFRKLLPMLIYPMVFLSYFCTLWLNHVRCTRLYHHL